MLVNTLISGFATLILSSSSTIPVQQAKLPDQLKNNITNPCITVDSCIDYYSELYNVPKDRLHYMVNFESQYNPKAIGDMDITCKRTRKPVRARGILQITECYYPEVKDSCAFDVQCSFEFAINIIKNDETCRTQWTSCREYMNRL